MPVVIKMKGLPFEATAKDIQMFFDGLYLREDDIHLAAYKDGKASGIAFAVFHNDEDARQAMFRNEKYIGKRYIELFLSSTTEMSEMLDEGVPDPKPSRHQLGHQQRGLNNEARDIQRSRNVHRDDQSRPRNIIDRRGLQESRGGNDGRMRQDGRGGDRILIQENRGGDEGRMRQDNRGGERMRQDNQGGNRMRQENRAGGNRMRQGNRGNDRGRQNRGKDDRRGAIRSRSRSPRQDNHQRSRGEGDNFKDSSRPSYNRNVSQDERQVEIASNVPSVFERMGRSTAKVTGMFVNDNTGFGELFGSAARFPGNSFRSSFGNGGDMRRQSYRTEERKEVKDPLKEMVCVCITELPFVVSEREVRYFFKGLDVVQVKFLFHYDGRFAGKKTGEGFVEFKTVRDAMQAEKKHKEKIGKRFIGVKAVSKIEMLKTVEKNELEMRRLESESNKRRTSEPVSDLAININPTVIMQEASVSRIRDRGLDVLGMSMSQPGPYISMDSYDAQAQAMTTLNKLATTANINPDDVAAGCVVGIRNLPSSITADEILDFFYGYFVFRDSVRIHYLAPGRSSGDAMVTLRNSQEAAAAIQELNLKNVGKRSVQLFLV